MRTIVLALAAAATLTAIGSRPSEARPWYPWCAQYADRSGATSCAFSSLEQCRMTINGIGGGCMQNWRDPDVAPRYVRPPRHRRYY